MNMVVRFFPSTVQHSKSNLLFLPCLPIFHLISKQIFNHTHYQLYLHGRVIGYMLHEFISDEFQGQLAMCLACFTDSSFAMVKGLTTGYLPPSIFHESSIDSP